MLDCLRRDLEDRKQNRFKPLPYGVFLRQMLTRRTHKTQICWFCLAGAVVDLHSTRIMAVSFKVASRAGLVASQRSSLPLSSRLASISNLADATLPLAEYSDFNCEFNSIQYLSCVSLLSGEGRGITSLLEPFLYHLRVANGLPPIDMQLRRNVVPSRIFVSSSP